MKIERFARSFRIQKHVELVGDIFENWQG